MQFVYVDDLVAAMVRSMEEPRAVGEAFNIGDPKPITQVELVEKLARVANVEPVLARVPRENIQQAGGNAMEEPFYFGEYLDVPPITENIGKVTRMLKVPMTPFETGLKEAYRWYTRNHKPRTAGFEFDDKLLAMARTQSPASV
jgi:nucleoside-diphosphate-sugar epimerase